jgi:NADH-quinone oxidoreductase subunit N
MGAFAVVIALAQTGERNEDVGDYAGLWTTRPTLAISMAVFMLALLGFPIAGGMGFFAKWYVLQAALSGPTPLVFLSIMVVVASVISAGYYLYVIMVMFMRPRPADAIEPARTPAMTEFVIGAAVVLLLVFGIFPGRLVDLTKMAAPATHMTSPVTAPPTASLGDGVAPRR